MWKDVIPLVVSVAAIFVSFLAYRNSIRSRLSSVFTELTQQSNIVNNAMAQFDVQDPYAILLHMKHDPEFGALQAVFFHQLNILYIVYRNRKYIGKKGVAGYKAWADRILRPWIESDPRLVKLWAKYSEHEDMLSKEFLEWLKSSIGRIQSPDEI